MLIRRQIVLILLAIIPTIFLFIVAYTTSDRALTFQLASVGNQVFIEVNEKQISIIFIAVAVVGFLLSFLALNLLQINKNTNRRLIICGYHPLELLISNLLSLLLLIVIIAIYVALLSNAFINLDNLFWTICGLALTGFVYSCYGLIIGSLIDGELEGILFIVLLANIDAGWLQNPLFYAQAQNQIIIQYLPAYFPSQTAITAAFTEYSIIAPVRNSIIYGLCLLAISILIYFTKMRIKK